MKFFHAVVLEFVLLWTFVKKPVLFFRLQMQTARLEATVQQQAKTIEVLETIQQSLTSVSYQSLPCS